MATAEFAHCVACDELQPVARTTEDDEPMCGRCAAHEVRKCEGCGCWSDDIRGPDYGPNWCPTCRDGAGARHGDWHGVQVR